MKMNLSHYKEKMTNLKRLPDEAPDWNIQQHYAALRESGHERK
jgi:hypothetical protein